MNTPGALIKKFRTEKGLTQKELGEIIGISQSAIGQLEKNENTPKFSTLKRIADALDISVFDLIEPGTKVPVTIPGIEYPTRMVKEDEYKKMSAAEKEDYDLRLLADMSPDTLKEKLIKGYDGLNKLGKVEAVKRTLEIAECKKYIDPDVNYKDISFTFEMNESDND